MMRKYWIDTLKWSTILWVGAFHISCMFNSCGMSLGVAPGAAVTDAVGYFTYPWIMPLMFLLSGIAARDALARRTPREFRRERARRLLLPTLGLLIFVAPALCSFTWWSVGTSFGEMARVIPLPVVLLIAFLCGIGPGWFLPVLFLCSLLLLPLRRLDRERPLVRIWLWLAGAELLFWLATGILPVPDRYLAYLAAFLAGYFLCGRPEVLDLLRRARLPLGILAGGAFLLTLVLHWGEDFAGAAFLAHPVTVLFGWSFCLFALGLGQARLDRPHPFWEARGFAVYLFHYLPMLAAAVFTTRWGWPVWARYAMTAAAALAIPLALYELLIRIPPLRRLFGLKRT